MSSGRLFVFIQSNVPVTLLIRAPRRILVEALDVEEHGVEVLQAVSGERFEKVERVSAVHMALALGCILVAMGNLK